MAKSIKLGGDTYWDASGIAGIRGTLTSDNTIEGLIHRYDSGVYYCSGVPDTPASYGMLIVFSSGNGASAAYHIFVSSASAIYTRYRNANAWGSWRKFTGTVES